MAHYKPKTVAGIDRQIEQLQALRSETYASEREIWKPRLQAKFYEFDYNAVELGFDLQTGKYMGPPPEMVSVPAVAAKSPNKKTKKTKKKSDLGPLFADKHGNTWSGKGHPNAWIQAVEAAGGSREDFRQRAAKTTKGKAKAKSNGQDRAASSY